ncbi:hypothetical protein DFP72DRAFT_1091738 [Ephemerocybe angulata]|uniref:Uncharacterized protein n=1 Tax=Ephemerocybe angulata TaxID=980116 RepID=A0A8H6HG18_9AGAR|nr:hypothetical protein DFP72DRAFT_1091738 [Tulosesus angulatus]
MRRPIDSCPFWKAWRGRVGTILTSWRGWADPRKEPREGDTELYVRVRLSVKSCLGFSFHLSRPTMHASRPLGLLRTSVFATYTTRPTPHRHLALSYLVLRYDECSAHRMAAPLSLDPDILSLGQLHLLIPVVAQAINLLPFSNHRIINIVTAIVPARTDAERGLSAELAALDAKLEHSANPLDIMSPLITVLVNARPIAIRKERSIALDARNQKAELYALIARNQELAEYLARELDVDFDALVEERGTTQGCLIELEDYGHIKVKP